MTVELLDGNGCLIESYPNIEAALRACIVRFSLSDVPSLRFCSLVQHENGYALGTCNRSLLVELVRLKQELTKSEH